MLEIELEACLPVALEMLAFRMCDRAGLIPQARHGGKGVCSLASVGSKLDGTGFEKLQMVQTQVAAVAGDGVGAVDRFRGSVPGAGEGEPLPVGV